MSSQPDRSSLAVLLVLHGTQDPTGLGQAKTFCNHLSIALQEWRGMAVRIYPSFLELVEPSVEQTLVHILQAGFKDIVVVPVMLLTGNHVRRDIPELIDGCVRRHAKEPLNLAMAAPLGVRVRLAGLALSRSLAALERAGASQHEVAYVMVGRGTREPEAIREMEAVFTMVTPASWGRTLLCYFAAVEPRVEDTLEEAARSGYKVVLVQPYLLFEGFLTNHLRNLLQQYGRRFPAIKWIQADVLGPDLNVVDVTKENILNALERMFATPQKP